MKRKRTPLHPQIKAITLEKMRTLLPPTWVIHDYGAEYGMDCLIEIFDRTGNNRQFTDTLGEMLYVKLKVAPDFFYAKKKIYPRAQRNVSAEIIDYKDFFEVETASVRMDVAELLAVQAMGPAVPVLLVLFDTTLGRAFFVCLNDYVDKILSTTEPDFAQKDSRIIHIPLTNEILPQESNLLPLRVLGKRAKMYAAFNRFAYQLKEISKINKAITQFNEKIPAQQVIETVKSFACSALKQDIWHFDDYWSPIAWSHQELNELLIEIEKGINPQEMLWFLQSCQQIWSRLDNLSNIYEDLVREWFLPTFLSQLMVCDTNDGLHEVAA